MSIPASTNVWTLDGVSSATGSPPTAAAAGYPSNYYIVIDDILVTMTANGAGNYSVTLAADDGQTLAIIGKTFLSAEVDTFHLPFPRGLALPKLTRALTGNGRADVYKEAAYSSATIFTVNGSPTACTITVCLRYIAPAEVGL